MLSLDAHWSSGESLWLRHSSHFMYAVKNGMFSDTLIDYHPGVTTMWLAGLRTFFIPQGVNVNSLVLARVFIGIVVWVGIGLANLVIYRLFGKLIALASFTCLAYSPLFLAKTQNVLTDALAATFILLAVLLFLLYCQNRHQHRHLILSGIAYGLALLSKSHALILLPWIPLCLFLFREKRTFRAWTDITAVACFLNCAVLTVLVLWPVFWSPIFGLIAICLLGLNFLLFRKMKTQARPPWLIGVALAGLLLACVQLIRSIGFVFDRVLWAVTTPHEVDHFFLGKVVNDPGWLFYPFVLTIKSTPLMLPLAIVACILLWKHRDDSEETVRLFKTGLALVVAVVLFTVCLSATRKKFIRYLLPAFTLLEILAAIGFIEGLKWGYNVMCSHFGIPATAKYKQALAVLACIGFFFIQTFPVIARHPYYSTYYNPCWKVTDLTKIITVGDASGLDIAANYLNQKPNAHGLSVRVSPLVAEIMGFYFQGHTYTYSRYRQKDPDYEVVYIRDSQIGRVPQTGTLNGEIEAVITLNGIDHVWIYRIRNKETP